MQESGSPSPQPSPRQEPGPSRAAAGGERGSLGCLGWGLIVAGVLVVAGVGAFIALWLLLPTLVSPVDPDWEMAGPDPERTEEIRGELEEGMDRALIEGRAGAEVTQEDLNILLAQALERWQPPDVPPEHRPRLRFLVGDGAVTLEVVGPVSEDMRGVPGRLRGVMTGVALDLRPRAAGDALAMGVEGARVGRIPLPVGLAMNLVPHLPLDPEAAFLDPARGELRIPLEPLVGVPSLPEGVRLEDLEVVDGALLLEFAASPG